MYKISLISVAVLLFAVSALAGMAPNAIIATQAGINGGLTLFYTIGGTILIVLAGIWGFRKITGLLGGGSGWSEASESQYDYKKIQHDMDVSHGNQFRK